MIMNRNETVELTFAGAAPTGSQVAVDVSAKITGPEGTKTVKGFYAGDDTYKVRFLPEAAGTYTYSVTGVVAAEGTVEVKEAREGHHGVVRADGLHFTHQDGKNFAGFGTTVYALAHQSDELMDQTIATLKEAPFNKVRMCVFPKHYNYNHNEPQHYPFALAPGKEGMDFSVEAGETDPAGDQSRMQPDIWDVNHPNVAFWDAFEVRLQQLFDLGIQVDLILFHPYDRWGFSSMTREDNLTYLDYVIRRFAAYPNIWWSMANEYDLCFKKDQEDWDAIGNFLKDNDPYHHLVGNHNCFPVFDASRDYITHVSLQNKTMGRVAELQQQYGKPVCYDECAYEGNINETWGNISGKEMTRRFWQVTVTGGHCTHGETYLDPALAYDNSATVWWSRGGKLIGESPKRIAFLRDLVESLPGPLEARATGMGKVLSMPREQREALIERVPEENRGFFRVTLAMEDLALARHVDPEKEYVGQVGDEVLIYYNDINCYGRRLIELPEGRTYKIEVIDTWNMTRETVATGAKGEGPQGHYEVRMPLPAKEYMAIFCTAE
jgi:hypothetical protein